MEDPTRELRPEPPGPPVAPPVPPPPWYREHWWIFLVVLLLIVGGIIAYFALRDGGDDQPDRVVVPNVTGTREPEARALLRERGFSIEVVREPSAEREGVVLTQDPRGGSRVARGSLVTITVSTGPQATQTETETQTETLTAPAPPETTELPDVVGLGYPDAVEQLVDVELLPNTHPVESSEERGTVVGQQPRAGASVQPGTAVRIDVSLGAGERAEQEIPELTGLRLAEALEACADAGFTCRIAMDSQPGGRVSAQEPAAGGRAPELTQITLFAGP
jgi:eukaryotic-like serine/threonine-protein kinase